MIAKLIAPSMDKNWSLQLFDVPNDKQIQNEIWYHARIIGQHFKVNPFLQGNSEGWMMIEYWTSEESFILEAAVKTCEKLKISLDF